jgi:hypothetical protein
MARVRDAEHESPAWGWSLAGFLAVALALEARPSPERPPPPAAGLLEPRAEARLEIEDMSARELRRLPGVGEKRALAIAQERWRLRGSGRALVLEDVPGIGTGTASAVRSRLEALDANALQSGTGVPARALLPGHDGSAVESADAPESAR